MRSIMLDRPWEMLDTQLPNVILKWQALKVRGSGLGSGLIVVFSNEASDCYFEILRAVSIAKKLLS